MLRPKKFIPSLAIAMMSLSGCGDDGGGNSGTSDAAGGDGNAGEGDGNGAQNACTDPDEAVEAFCTTLESVCLPGTQEDIGYCVADTDYALEPLRLDEPECVEALTSYFCCISNLECEDVRAGTGCDDEAGRFDDACTPEVSITI